jgi:hypothetical protein
MGIIFIGNKVNGRRDVSHAGCVIKIKLSEENPSIGIIICKSKDKTYVEYALKQSNVPIGVATYKLSESLPEDMKEMLPEPEEIVRKLKVFEKS